MIKLRILLFCIALLLGTSVIGQTTKSSLSGAVCDQNKQLIQGATVRVIHQPTLTEYGTATNKTGWFYLPDMKPGGPYQVEVSCAGYETYLQKDVYLQVDQPWQITVVLKANQILLPEILIKSALAKKAILSMAQTGPNVKIGQPILSALPTVKRSINDYIRLSPQAFGPAIAGGNYRQNFITIDGSEFNNNFGVGDNLPGNGAQPISLDAIDQLSVNIAPYNAIWESGFIGSAINIVTRSGSNQTEASAYRFFRNQNSYGYQVGNQTFDKNNVAYHQDGLRIGGPIIRNKLFYFLSAEIENERYNPQQLLPSTVSAPYGSSPNISRPTDTELNNIANYLRNTYGYDPGQYGNYTFTNKSIKLLGRLDWNIAANNTFSIRYNWLRGERPELVNGSRSPLTPFPASSGRRSPNALPFSKSNFSTLSDFYSLAAEWNKKVSPTLTNTFRASYTRQFEPRQTSSELFPFVDILKDGVPFTSFGYEPFTYGNSRNVSLISAIDYLNFNHNKSNWLAGVQLDYSNTTNTYIPFGTGYYTFASWDDFVTGRNPVDYALTYTTTPGVAQPSYSFKYTNTAVFLQNTIMVGKHSNLTAGFRVDVPWFPQSLAENFNIAALTFSGGQQLHTAQLPHASVLLSPRIGITLQLNDEGTLRLRGGSGLFTGRIPFVWIVSQARYSGLRQVTQTWQGIQNTPGGFNPDPQAYAPVVSSEQNQILPSITSVLAKDFKMPQTWKSSIGLDMRLPAGFTATIETLYNKDINAITFKDVNLVTPQALNIPGYPDHRLVYPAANNQRYINPLNTTGLVDANGNSPFNAVVVGNTSKGYYWSVTTQLDKKLANGLALSAAYIRSMAKNLNDGDGDQTLSALNATPTVNGINQAQLGYAGYVSSSRVLATVTYHKSYLKKLRMSIGLVYQGAIDGRFSYTYSQDFVHDGTNKALIYIPRDPSEITFVPLTVNQPNKITYTAADQSAAFFKYVEQDDHLRAHKGSYAERNGAVLPWRNQWDIRLTHDFVIGTNDTHTLQLSWDIFNFGNLLNKNWGVKKLVNASAILNPANLAQVIPNGNVKPTFQLATVGGRLITETFKNDVSLASTYVMQFGIRYSFN